MPSAECSFLLYLRVIPVWRVRNLREGVPASLPSSNCPLTGTCHIESRFCMNFSNSHLQLCQNREKENHEQRLQEKNEKRSKGTRARHGDHTGGTGSSSVGAALPWKVTLRNHLSPRSLTDRPNLSGPSWGKGQGPIKPPPNAHRSGPPGELWL